MHLEEVVEDDGRAQGEAAAVDGAHDGVDDVGGHLKDVGPHVVEQVRQGILAAQPRHSQRHVLHNRRRRLPVHLQPDPPLSARVFEPTVMCSLGIILTLRSKRNAACH